MAKQQNDRTKVRINAPRGPFKYPALDKPDYGTDKFPDKDGSYKTKVVFDRADVRVAKFLEKIDQLLEKAREEAEAKFAEMPVAKRKKIESDGGLRADAPYSTVYDPDTEEDTGKVEMLFKMKASGVRKKDDSKWTQRPDLFDGKGKPFPKGVPVWGGTEGIIVFDAETYFVEGTAKYGVSRRLLAAQILDHVGPGGSRSASSYGFEEHEDGFDASDLAADEKSGTDGDTSGTDGGSGDSSQEYDF